MRELRNRTAHIKTAHDSDLLDRFSEGEVVPDEVRKFVETGGVSYRILRAARQAAHLEKKFCLSELERMRAELPPNASLFTVMYLDREIASLRRSMASPPERRRAQTRERVHRHRARKAQEA